MKIGEYEQMMAYLTRPGFNDGGSSEVVEIDFASKEDQAFQDMMKAYKYYLSTGGKKSLKDYMRMATGVGRKGGGREHFRATGGRVNLADGTEKIVEPPKSMQMDTTTRNPIPKYDINDFRNDAETFILAYHNNTLPRADIADKLNAFAQKGIDAGTFTGQDAGVMVRRLIGEVKDRAQKQRLREVVPEGIGTVDREEFSEGTKTKLVEFVEKFKLENNRIPTQTEIVKGTGKAAKTIKSYLEEGVDYAKLLTKAESAKLGGRQAGSVKEIDKEAFSELKNLTKNIKGISIQTTGNKSKSAGLRIGKQYQQIMDQFLGGQPTKYFPADREGIEKLKNLITQIADSDIYKETVTPFKTRKQELAVNRAKDAQYRKKDPFQIYRKLREYKTEKFPEQLSRDIQIQHGQPKFTTQTLSRMGLIPRKVNVSKDIANVEKLRNDLVKKTNFLLKNPNRSISDKKQIIEEFNNIMKGLRGQLKGTPGQGLVNFELLDIDEKGNIKKLKDVGFNPKKGLAYGNELGELDLSKITKEQADEIIALGKKQIDLDLIKRTTPVTTADKIKRPESAVTRDMIKDFEVRTKMTGPELDANRALLKGIGETLKAVPTPAGTLALTAGFGVDPTSTIDRVALEAEAALAPELVKQTSRLTSNPIVQRFFNLGLSPANAMRVARAAQPLGVASLIGEGIYELGKRGVAEKAKIDAMTPFQKQQYLAGEIEPLMDEGGIVDISREGFSVGGLASLFKKAAQVSEALRNVKNATFSMFNNVRMFGNQKGIEKNLEGFTNIPEKNPKLSALEDIQKLKATVPEKYHQDLNIMMKSVEQNNFETAWKEYQKFEKDLDPSLKFENIPQEYFPMLDPLNDAFVIQGPRDSFKTGRYQIKTSMELDKTGKPTGKYQTEKYDTFDPETRTFRDEPELVGASTEKGKEGLN
jgi:hypothetical protein